MNNKGQFSIIAALLVAVVLIASAMTTYSSIRYASDQEQPQILSSVDESDLALKQLLGFTVGYYGSVLKVTGNVTYAQQLASGYLNSSLTKIGDIKPEWGMSLNVTDLKLSANWFTNDSYSQGSLRATYDLNGLGITGVSYNASSRLEVKVSDSNSSTQAQFRILTDNDEPLINLGTTNIKFYRYEYGNSSWEFSAPTSVISRGDGTYLVDLPPGVPSTSYVVQVEDTRGMSVLASTYSQFTSAITWNSTAFRTDKDYVDLANLNVIGTHGNFTAQQSAPDGVFDSLAEAASGLTYVPSYPTTYNLYGLTKYGSGSISDLQSNNGVYLSYQSYPTSFSGTAIFGYNQAGANSNSLSYVRGSRYTTGASSGLANSISAYLSYTATTANFGNTNNGASGQSVVNTIRGQLFTSPSSAVVAQSIVAYIDSSSSTNVKAAIYTDSPYNLVASSQQTSASGIGWVTFTFATPPTLSPSTNYVLVVWAQSGAGNVNLRYSSASGGNGRSYSQTYGTWPSQLSPSNDAYRYSLYCNYASTFKAQAAIYSSDGQTFVGSTEEKILSTVNGWVTFNFITQPMLTASTNYVLGIESSDTTNVNVYYGTTAQYFRANTNYPTWPTTLIDQGSQRSYSLYCNYSLANQYTAQVELTGNSAMPFPWNDLIWTVDGSASTSSVPATFQLYNWTAAQYPASGDGFMSTTLSSSDTTKTQTVSVNPSNFVNSSGYWKIMIAAVKSTATPFVLNLDMVQYSPDVTNYAINLQEQWTSINATNLRQDLCIKTGSLGSESLTVQILQGGSWTTLMTLIPNWFNNVSLSPFINSATLTIRFIGGNETTDPIQDIWNIDSVFIKDEPDISYLINLQQPTLTIELLQNGTMRWLGQNLQLTTQTLPIPPIPIKDIRLNQTINGVNQQVPFQIEDWASNYQIPLGLTSNSTVFGNRQMIVFLLNSKVTDFTVWWDGSDVAAQTPLAFTSTYFTNDNTALSRLTNGIVTLQFGSFNVKSTVAGTSSTATFMRINQQNSTYGAGLAYVIQHGIVRDVVQQEAEWNNGPTGCPNLYANIVLTLPANATYYTYQLRIMFINSTQARSITDLSPIQLTTSLTSPTLQTENSLLAGFPTLQNGTGTFLNSTIGGWTPHHFSQFILDSGKGAGIMFTNQDNQRLYALDSIAGSPKGAVKASSGIIELLPVSSSQVQFNYAYDITWQGAVVTFDGTTPICGLYDGTTPFGLWMIAEYPPTITVTVKS